MRFLKSLKGLKRKTVLMKLIISYLLMLVLLIISNLFIYSRTKSVIITKEIAYNEMSLDYTKDIIDQETRGILDSSISLLKNSHVKNSLMNIERVGNQSYIINQLIEFTQKNDLVDHAILYNPSLDHILYEEGSLSMEYAFDKYFKYEDFTKDALINKFKEAPVGYIARNKIRVTSDVNEVTKNYITIYFSTHYSKGDNKLILLIPENKLKNMFKDVYAQNKFMIISHKGDIIVDKGLEETQIEFKDELLSVMEEKQSNLFKYKDYLIIHKPSEFLNWRYIIMIDYKNILTDINIIKTIISYLIFAILIISILIISFSIKENYFPLKKILGHIEDEEKMEENEFDMIRNNIINLNKINSMNHQNKIISEALQYDSTIDKVEGLFKYSLVMGILIVCKDIERIHSLKAKLIEEIKAVEDVEVKLIYSDKNEVYILLNGDKLESKLVEAFFEENLEQSYSTMLIGVGTVERIDNLKKSCEMAKEAIREGKISNLSHIYYPNNESEVQSIYLPIDFESNILSYIYAANKSQVRRLLEEIFDKNRDITYSQLKKLAMDLIEIYVKLAEKVEALYDIKAIKARLEDEYGVDVIKEYTYAIYEQLVYEEAVDRKAGYVGKYIKDYVGYNYMDSNISIEGIASDLNLASTYVSTLFKKEVKVSFSQYLSDYRIEKAKYLLDYTDKKVKDIAAETGFGTYNNFARVFKKKIGVTPKEYKNSTEDEDCKN